MDPQRWEIVFDAGCGSGANILLLHSRVKQIIGMDYSDGAIARCEARLAAHTIENANLMHGDVTSSPLRDNSIDKILCMSVLQYLTDTEVRKSFDEFVPSPETSRSAYSAREEYFFSVPRNIVGGQEDKTTSQDENEVGAPPFLRLVR